MYVSNTKASEINIFNGEICLVPTFTASLNFCPYKIKLLIFISIKIFILFLVLNEQNFDILMSLLWHFYVQNGLYYVYISY
jgi:hypothetical protein